MVCTVFGHKVRGSLAAFRFLRRGEDVEEGALQQPRFPLAHFPRATSPTCRIGSATVGHRYPGPAVQPSFRFEGIVYPKETSQGELDVAAQFLRHRKAQLAEPRQDCGRDRAALPHPAVEPTIPDHLAQSKRGCHPLMVDRLQDGRRSSHPRRSPSGVHAPHRARTISVHPVQDGPERVAY